MSARMMNCSSWPPGWAAGDGGAAWRLATAESCTGGWIAKCLTDIPGSSAWFDRGFVSYSNEAKSELLDVPAALIEQSGAVSEASRAGHGPGCATIARPGCALR